MPAITTEIIDKLNPIAGYYLSVQPFTPATVELSSKSLDLREADLAWLNLSMDTTDARNNTSAVELLLRAAVERFGSVDAAAAALMALMDAHTR